MRWLLPLVLLLAACGESQDSPAQPPDAAELPDLSLPEAEDVPEALDTKKDVPKKDTQADAFVPGVNCPPWVDCDDGLKCTVDDCIMPGQVCTWTVKPAGCLINNVCVDGGTPDPDNPCGICDPEYPTHWRAVEDGTQCDEDQCLENFSCQAGTCVGDGNTCDDSNPCTVDSCDPALGCQSTPAFDGISCQNKGLCAEDGQCFLGICVGAPIACDDGDPCTIDTCHAVKGCQYTAAELIACDDGDVCTSDDICKLGVCKGGASTSCDDQNPCSVDICHSLAGCIYVPTQSPCCTGLVSVCDDGDACTTDTCSPETQDCAHVLNTKNCNDNNPCTAQDLCSGGLCAGVTKSCDDGDPCTQDSCDSLDGCQTVAISGVPCSDNIQCTTQDTCVNGQCVGDDSGCGCTVEPTWDANKATKYLLGASGHPGEGIDVDADLSTCAPVDDCSGGIDNAFALLGSLANAALQETVDDGGLMLIFLTQGDKTPPFTLSIHDADLAQHNESCDFTKSKCDYRLKDDGFDKDCDWVITLPNCAIVGSKMTCGGPGTTLPFELPVQDGVVLVLSIFNVRLEADVTVSASGNLTSLDGVFGGAIQKDALISAIDNLKDEDLPLPKDVIKNLFQTLIKYDIDTNNSGTPDAASIGFSVTLIDANATEIKP